MWTAPCLQELCSCGSDRLRSYVRSVDAVAHDRCQDGFRDARSKHNRDVGHRRWVPRSVSRLAIDRSHHLLRLEQASASARGEDRRALNGVFRLQDQRRVMAGHPLVWSRGPSASFRPTAALQAPCASGVKAGRRPPPQAARSGLDGASTALHCRSGGRSGSWPQDGGCSVGR